MRRYIVTLALMAILVGSLFKASQQTGVRLMNMFATLGIFLFGVVGTMALTRYQSREGLKEIEAALKSLEPQWLITDWLRRGGGYPDYLLVGPGGLVAVCVEETPQSAFRGTVARNLKRARERASASMQWVRERLGGVGPALEVSGGMSAPDLPIATVVVMNRRKAEPGFSTEGIPVLNSEDLARYVRRLWEEDPLDERARVTLTRALRAD